MFSRCTRTCSGPWSATAPPTDTAAPRSAPPASISSGRDTTRRVSPATPLNAGPHSHMAGNRRDAPAHPVSSPAARCFSFRSSAVAAISAAIQSYRRNAHVMVGQRVE